MTFPIESNLKSGMLGSILTLDAVVRWQAHVAVTFKMNFNDAIDDIDVQVIWRLCAGII